MAASHLVPPNLTQLALHAVSITQRSRLRGHPDLRGTLPLQPGQLTHLQGLRELHDWFGPGSDLLSVIVAFRNDHAADVTQLWVENLKAPVERRRWLSCVGVFRELGVHKSSV